MYISGMNVPGYNNGYDNIHSSLWQPAIKNIAMVNLTTRSFHSHYGC